MNNTLFLKEKEENTINDILIRIISYVENFVKAYNEMPYYIKMSNRDYKMILKYNKSLIDNNKILGMEIVKF